MPTVAKKNLKLLIMLVANTDFNLASMDIRAAFLQGNTLDRDIFMKPLDVQKMDGWLWKFMKLIYGLDDSIRKF